MVFLNVLDKFGQIIIISKMNRRDHCESRAVVYRFLCNKEIKVKIANDSLARENKNIDLTRLVFLWIL